MTRINTLSPRELTDQHLLAEYREITRVSSLAWAFFSRAEDCTIPPPLGQYTLGTGHVKFFYDKGKYLYLRTLDLYHECKKRGFNVQQKVYRSHPEPLNNLWFPDDLARAINLSRISERILEKPELYTWYGHKVYDQDGNITEFVAAGCRVPSRRMV